MPNPNSNNNGKTPSRRRPDHARPLERVREKVREARRQQDGDIAVGDDPIDELVAQIDWDNLSPFERYVLAILDREGLI